MVNLQINNKLAISKLLWRYEIVSSSFIQKDLPSSHLFLLLITISFSQHLPSYKCLSKWVCLNVSCNEEIDVIVDINVSSKASSLKDSVVIIQSLKKLAIYSRFLHSMTL